MSIYQILKTTGFEVAYNAFPEKSSPAYPYIVYLDAGGEALSADSHALKDVNTYRVELYAETAASLLNAVCTLRGVLSDNNIIYTRSEPVFVPEDRHFMTAFEFDEIE